MLGVYRECHGNDRHAGPNGGFHKRRPKWQYVTARGRGPLWKEQHTVTASERIADCGNGADQVALPPPVNPDDAQRFAEHPYERPVAHVILRHECAVVMGDDGNDIDPREVVGDEERGAWRELPRRPDLDVEQSQHAASKPPYRVARYTTPKVTTRRLGHANSDAWLRGSMSCTSSNTRKSVVPKA